MTSLKNNAHLHPEGDQNIVKKAADTKTSALGNISIIYKDKIHTITQESQETQSLPEAFKDILERHFTSLSRLEYQRAEEIISKLSTFWKKNGEEENIKSILEDNASQAREDYAGLVKNDDFQDVSDKVDHFYSKLADSNRTAHQKNVADFWMLVESLHRHPEKASAPAQLFRINTIWKPLFKREITKEELNILLSATTHKATAAPTSSNSQKINPKNTSPASPSNAASTSGAPGIVTAPAAVGGGTNNVSNPTIVDAGAANNEEPKGKNNTPIIDPDVIENKEDEVPKDAAEVPADPVIEEPDANLNAVFVNIETKIREAARMIAQEDLDHKLKAQKGFFGFFKKAFMRNAYEGYLEKQTEENIARIRKDRTFITKFLARERGGQNPIPLGTEYSLEKDLNAVAARFGIAWNEQQDKTQVADHELLTRNEVLKQENFDGIQKDISILAKRFVSGELGKDKNAAVAAFKKEFTTHILPSVETAQQGSIVAFLENREHRGEKSKMGLIDRLILLKEHADRLNAIDLKNITNTFSAFIDSININIAAGTAEHVGARTNLRETSWADKKSKKVMQWLQKIPFLREAASPASLSVLVYGGLNMLTNYSIATFGKLSIFGGAITGGLIGGIRQNAETARLKQQEEIRSAFNFKPSKDSIEGNEERRSNFEEKLNSRNTIYEKHKAALLIEDFKTLLENPEQNKNELWKHLAKVYALRELSEFGVDGTGKNRMDLISFTDESRMEKDRLDLYYQMAAARKFLEKDNPDFKNQFLTAWTEERSHMIESIEAKDRNFKKLKAAEVRSARLTGAVTGILGSLIGSGLATGANHLYHWYNPGAYTFDETGLTEWLSKKGFSAQDIKDHIVITDGKITPDSLKYLAEHGFPITKLSLFNDLGKPTDSETIKSLMSKYNLESSKFQLGTDGKPTEATLHYLKTHGFDITSHTTYANNSSNLLNNGFEEAKNTHFNHNPGRPAFDELRFHWDGAPGVRNGEVHFKIDDVLNSRLRHSRLPHGIEFPKNFNKMSFALQVEQDGHTYWKHFTPDSNGKLSIPAEFFNESELGYVPRGGNSLPGLKTSGMLVGFEDKNGTFQVLSSLRGDGTYLSDAAAEASKNAPSTTYTLKALHPEQYDVGAQPLFVPPVSASRRMQHLEYGKSNIIASDYDAPDDEEPLDSKEALADEFVRRAKLNQKVDLIRRISPGKQKLSEVGTDFHTDIEEDLKNNVLNGKIKGKNVGFLDITIEQLHSNMKEMLLKKLNEHKIIIDDEDKLLHLWQNSINKTAAFAGEMIDKSVKEMLKDAELHTTSILPLNIDDTGEKFKKVMQSKTPFQTLIAISYVNEYLKREATDAAKKNRLLKHFGLEGAAPDVVSAKFSNMLTQLSNLKSKNLSQESILRALKTFISETKVLFTS